MTGKPDIVGKPEMTGKFDIVGKPDMTGEPGMTVPTKTRSRSSLCLADAKLLLRLTACKSLSTEAPQRFLMAHAATHPFLV